MVSVSIISHLCSGGYYGFVLARERRWDPPPRTQPPVAGIALPHAPPSAHTRGLAEEGGPGPLCGSRPQLPRVRMGPVPGCKPSRNTGQALQVRDS